MDCTLDNGIKRACRIIFGPDVTVNRAFLNDIKSSSIARAFRKKALLTHPDRFSMRDAAARRKTATLFIEVKWAYDQLRKFCRERDKNIVFRSDTKTETIKARDKKNPGGFHQGKGYYSGNMPRRRLRLGEFLYYTGEVPKDAYINAVVMQGRQRPRFGDIALRWCFLSEPEINSLVSRKRDKEPIGETAVRLNLLSRSHVEAVLYYQRSVQKPIGEYFIANGYLSRESFHLFLMEFNKHNRQFI
jgi:curved DNA-binding protein CbpA